MRGYWRPTMLATRPHFPMKIRTTERLVTVISLAVIVLIAASIWWTYETVNTANRERQQASEIARGLSQLRLLTFEYRLYRFESTKEQWHAVSKRVDQLIEDTETSIPAQIQILDRIRARRVRVINLFTEIVISHTGSQPGALPDDPTQLSESLLLLSQILTAQQENFLDVFRLTDIASAHIISAQRRLLLIALAGLALFALIKTLASWFINHSVLAPIERLDQAARDIGEGHWDFNFEGAKNNEVGRLGASLSAMAKRIESQAAALQQTHDELELRVQERTAALEVAIKQLRGIQAALLESEQRFRAIFDHAGIGITMRSAHDRKLPWVQVNDHFCKLLGYTREELLKLSTADITPPDHKASAVNDNESMMRGEVAIYSREKQIIRKDGELIWVLLTVASLPGQDGRPTNLIATYHDITQRREAEMSIRRLNRVYSVLSGINTLIARVHDLPHLLSEACQIAVEQGQFGIAWIGNHDPNTGDITPVAWAGEYGETLAKTGVSAKSFNPRGSGVTGRAILQKKAIFVNDLTLEPDNGSERRRVVIQLGYRSAIGLPLIVDGEVVGALTLYVKERDFFDDGEVALLAELAGNISISMESIDRQHKFEKLSRIRAVSAKINAAIVRIHDRETLLWETCGIALKYGGFELAWIGWVDSKKEEVRSVAWSGFPDEIIEHLTWADFGAGRGTLAEAMRTREAYVRKKLEGDLPAGTLRQVAINKGYSSSVCLPLEVDEQAVAMIILFAKEEGFFDDDELALLKELAADVSFALQTITKQERLDYLSYYDPLTGLPNRTLFIDRTSQQMRSRGDEPRMVALMLINIERFRYINETFSHHGGDELLKLVAGRLERAFHGKDYLARIGGDGFGIVMRGISDSSKVLHVIENQVLGCFVRPFGINGNEIRVAAKVGVAIFPADGTDADRLYRNAEAALKKARESGERYLFYAAEMNARVAHILTLETRLRKAVVAQEFVLHYQPKYNLADEKMSGIEALIRWQDPDSGLVAPGVFIPLLEETGLILEVGKWALGQALKQHREWTALGLSVPRVAVNVSAIQLQQKNFADVVINSLQEQGDNADALELEVTESLLMKDVQSSLRMLSVLRGLGITIALDDFGTGYSSLAYISRLPITSIKIDRSFITGMTESTHSMSIVTTIIALAHSMNLKVVAEGVETEDQAKMLKALRCDEAQGYFFSKPVPAHELQRILNTL